MSLKAKSDAELFKLYRHLLVELRQRALVRSDNAPTGDYAEWLAQKVLGGHLADPSNPDWDLITPNRERLQIKARVVSTPVKSGQRRLSKFSSWTFDKLLVVLFDDFFVVQHACTLPVEIVPKPDSRVLYARQLITDPRAANLTDDFKAAQSG
jgi:hypothetical protein